jgi:hypothetical protein
MFFDVQVPKVSFIRQSTVADKILKVSKVEEGTFRLTPFLGVAYYL